MKIFAIGRNYADHAKEMNSPVPEEPVIFMKPQSALIKNDMPFDHPVFSKHIEYEVELVYRVSRNGRHVPEKEASKYYDAIGVGIDFTARDLQQKQKEKGLPWEISKAFDHSAPVSPFTPLDQIKDLNNVDFSLKKNDEVVQSGNSNQMQFNIDKIVSAISKYFTLNIGDLIFTGTPAGVGKVEPGDKLEAFLGENCLLTCEVK